MNREVMRQRWTIREGMRPMAPPPPLPPVASAVVLPVAGFVTETGLVVFMRRAADA